MVLAVAVSGITWRALHLQFLSGLALELLSANRIDKYESFLARTFLGTCGTLALTIVFVTRFALDLKVLLLSAFQFFHAFLIQADKSIAAHALVLAGLVTTTLVPLVTLWAFHLLLLIWATVELLDTLSILSVESLLADTRLIAMIFVAFDLSKLMWSAIKGLLAVSVEPNKSMSTSTLSSATGNTVLTAMWSFAFRADLLGLLVSFAMLHALHGRHTFISDPHKISFAEAPSLTALTTRRLVVGTILITTSATVQELLIDRTRHLASVSLRNAHSPISNESRVTETALRALFDQGTVASDAVLIAFTATRFVNLMIATRLRTNFVFRALSINSGESRLTEASLLTILITDFARGRTRFGARVAALGVELGLVTALVTFVIPHTLSVYPNEARPAETSLFTVCVTFLGRRWTGLLASISTFHEQLVAALVTPMTLFLRSTFTVNADESGATEASALTLFATVPAWERTRFPAATATLREVFVVTVTLLAPIILYAMAMDPRVSWSAKAALFTLLVTHSSREGTRLHAPISTIRESFMVIVALLTAVFLHALTIDTDKARLAETSLVAFLFAPSSWEWTRFRASISAFGEELVVPLTFFTFILSHALPVDSDESRFTEAALVTFRATLFIRGA